MELLKLYTGEVLIVTHSMEEAYKFCKNLVILEDGNSVLLGDTKEIFMRPELVSVARLIGCKNISSCSLVSANKIYSHEWDIEIEINESAVDVGFIGIKSNSFEVADDSRDANIIECEIIDIIEKIQGYTIIFTNKKSRNAASHMYFDIKKEKWNNRKNKNNLFLKIQSDSVLLLK
jgi:molybdate transport system ATP-binding protein